MKKHIKIGIFVLLLMSLLTGIVATNFFHRKHLPTANIPNIEMALRTETAKANSLVEEFIALVEEQTPQGFDALKRRMITNNHPHALYLFQHHTLTVWNTHEYSFDFAQLRLDNQWHFLSDGNTQAIYRSYTLNADLLLLYLIPIRHTFPYENEYLLNHFACFFPLDNQFTLGVDPKPESIAITDENERHLFYVYTPLEPKENEVVGIVGFLAYTLMFLLILFIYLNANAFLNIHRKLTLSQFLIITVSLFSFVAITAFIGFPSLFYDNFVFSPYHFAANDFVQSYTHLSVFIFFFVSAVYVFYQKTSHSNNFLIFNRLFLLFYVFLMYETLKSLVLHSSSQFIILQISDFNFINIWGHWLMFLLSAGLYFVLISALPSTYQQKLKERKKLLPNLSVYFLILCTILGITAFYLNTQKNENKYRVLTGNIMENGNVEYDPMAELLLQELNHQLLNDSGLMERIHHPDSAHTLTAYLNHRFLSGFWNKYEIRPYVTFYQTPEYENVKQWIQVSGNQINSTHFYSLPSSIYDLNYLGILPFARGGLHAFLVLEFQPKRNFRSFSFPELFIDMDPSVHRQNNISIAIYEHNHLVYSDNRKEWKMHNTQFSEQAEGFSVLRNHQMETYVFNQNNKQIVVVELAPLQKTAVFFYIIWCCLVFVFLFQIMVWIVDWSSKKQPQTYGLTVRFQLVFISLLLISLFGIFVFSVQFFRNKYQQEQIESADNKKRYIQEALKTQFFWTKDLNLVNEQQLNKELEVLSYTFQTDIHVYNNEGMLVGSSQDFIFRKNLISRLMPPNALFNVASSQHLQEQIGTLNYLSSYTEFFNGDYLHLGFIAIPRYLSQTEINAEIERFMTAIIQFYVLLLLLSVLILLLAGKQLSVPLKNLEEKLKSMHWGGKNERIDYKWKDEIGQLVEQYNRTVNELEKSTRLLLQSERESAWRTMARQVAHEINNPLTPMKLTIQQLQRMKANNESEFTQYFDKSTKTLIEQIDTLSRIAVTFSQFARLPETTLESVDIADKLFHVTTLYKNNYANIQIEYTGAENGIWVIGDADQLIQLFNNVLKNAIQALVDTRKGQIGIHIKTENKQVIIAISDNGKGISDEIQNDIFRPSFTTKSKGMGLGLSIAKNIVESMHGSISFVSHPGKKTTFTIAFPLETISN